jgi:hypothetical protein
MSLFDEVKSTLSHDDEQAVAEVQRETDAAEADIVKADNAAAIRTQSAVDALAALTARARSDDTLAPAAREAEAAVVAARAAEVQARTTARENAGLRATAAVVMANARLEARLERQAGRAARA